MYKKIKFPILLLMGLIVLLGYVSCEKEIEIDFPIAAEEIVVDGYIEQGKFPTVVLTKSSPYFASIDSASIANLVVTVAKVTVSDGTNSEILTLKRNDKYFPPFYYQGTSLIGEVGKTYSLTIDLGGKQYTSSTTIPAPVSINNFNFFYNDRNDSVASIQINFNDPPAPGNYYRIFTKRLGKDDDYIPAYFATFSDAVFNGTAFKFQLLKGTESVSNKGRDLDYRKGDTVFLKFCTLDREHFDFWKKSESQLYTASNPLAVSNTETVSMIKGGLGVWGGYGVKQYSIIVK